MPTQLEELVAFLGAPQSAIRQIAIENLLGYTVAPRNAVFKTSGLKPIQDLKVLVRDKHPISENALKALVNLSDDPVVLKSLATDDAFLELLLEQITNPSQKSSDLIAMLLTNMAKHNSIPEKILSLKRAKTAKEISESDKAMDQLMDLFVKGGDKNFNKDADFDYLAYFFADVARHPKGRKHFVTRQEYDDVVPLSKIVVFTEHKSLIRRKGVASTIKNALFETSCHKTAIDEDSINLLPYILLPVMGSEEYSEEDSASMPADLQLLPPDKERETDPNIISTHLESVMLLTTTRPVREKLRELGVYPVVREVHLAVDDDKVREVCERLVDVLMSDEADEGKDEEEEEIDSDDEIVDIV